MSLHLHKLVSTYELDPIVVEDFEAVLRIEVFESGNHYFAKMFRFDIFRLIPYGRGENEIDLNLCSDEEILVREIPIGARIEELRESSEARLLKKIAAVIEEVFGQRVIL